MKTFPQLAQSAYEAYRKEAISIDPSAVHAEVWKDLSAGSQACWEAAARQMAAEIAALH